MLYPPEQLAVARQNAKLAKLTLKQFRYFSLSYSGWSQEQIAAECSTKQQRVSEVIRRALQRNPNLPVPARRLQRA